MRTEVVEVTRAMLDRSNANFLLWPPCVEVQRCSGCCNAKSLQCVPFVTHTRYLQVADHTHTHEHGGSSKHLCPRNRRGGMLRLLLSSDCPSCSRLLQVMKIEYVNKKPTYSRVVVSVVDHVECRCQAATRAPAPRKKSPHKHHGHQHRNETLSQEHGGHEQVQCEHCFLTKYASNINLSLWS